MRYRSLAALAAILAAVYDRRRGIGLPARESFLRRAMFVLRYATIILASSAEALDPPPLLTI